MTDSTDAPPGDTADPPLDPLDFIPVVRKIKRPDGWTAELQRDYIRRLAISGSPLQACIEMGKNVSGIEALYKVPGADSFRAAWDHAVQVGRTAQGLDCGPPHLGPVPGIQRRTPRNVPGAAWPDDFPPDEDPAVAGMSFETKRNLLESILRKYVRKVEHEREARLDGRIVEADFTLRQITCVEIALDLAALRLGTSGWEVLHAARRDGHGIFDIAETQLSRVLDAERRAVWAEAGAPERPEHPPQRYLSDCGDYSVEPTEFLRGGDDQEEQIAARYRQHREDAKAQVEWESSQRRAYEERRASDASA